MNRGSRCSAVLAALLLLAPAAGLHAQELPRTWQEEHDFRAGPTPFGPLMQFWYDLDAASDLVSMQPLTRTLLGRQTALVVIADEPITTPQDALRSGKTIVLIGPSVHGGEVSPKEALQLVAKDLYAAQPPKAEANPQPAQMGEAQIGR